MPKKKDVIKHYDQAAKDYHKRYQRENLYDTGFKYPANYFRMQLMLKSIVEKKVGRLIEVGVGEGTPLAMMAQAGVEVYGFDISKKMVAMAKKTMTRHGLDPENIFFGDIEDPLTYMHVLKQGPMDALVALGVMPHVENDEYALTNMSSLVRPGGTVYIEFRNKLFSLFTFNRYTKGFILDDLLAGVDLELKKIVSRELDVRLRTDIPPRQNTAKPGCAPGYEDLDAKWHNPFEVREMFERLGYEDIRPLWYHYHPAMPYLEAENPVLFRKEGILLEKDMSGWRGFFLCSAFVVEAVKKRDS